MNNKQIIAAVLALSLSMATANSQAAEASADLGANIKQLIAEIHVGTADWNKIVTRIDKLVARIDEQVLEGTGDFDELKESRLRLMNARTKIVKQHLGEPRIGENGEVLIGENGEVLTADNGEVLVDANGSDIGFGTSVGNSGGGFHHGSNHSGGIAGGGGGGGGFSSAGGGGLGALASVGAWFALSDDNDTGLVGNVASEINP